MIIIRKLIMVSALITHYIVWGAARPEVASVTVKYDKIATQDMFDAIKNWDVARLTTLLESGKADVNAKTKDSDEYTSLGLALLSYCSSPYYLKKLAIIRLLLLYGVDQAQMMQRRLPLLPIFIAASNTIGSTDLLDIFLSCNKKLVNARDYEGNTLLMYVVNQAIKSKYCPNKETALLRKAFSLNVIARLLKEGADIALTNHKNKNALEIVLFANNAEVIKALSVNNNVPEITPLDNNAELIEVLMIEMKKRIREKLSIIPVLTSLPPGLLPLIEEYIE